MNGQIKLTHNFQQSLDQSHKVSELPFWYDLYEQFFPDMVSMQTYKEYGYWQDQGVDRGIILSTSKQILIDEKVRYRNAITGRVYEDIALEYWSNYEKRVPGWVCKPLMCDYILYLILPLRRAYLLPVIQLQQAWCKNRDKWLSRGQIIKARNEGYTSHSIGVDADVLYPAMGCCLRHQY